MLICPQRQFKGFESKQTLGMTKLYKDTTLRDPRGMPTLPNTPSTIPCSSQIAAAAREIENKPPLPGEVCSPHLQQAIATKGRNPIQNRRHSNYASRLPSRCLPRNRIYAGNEVPLLGFALVPSSGMNGGEARGKTKLTLSTLCLLAPTFQDYLKVKVNLTFGRLSFRSSRYDSLGGGGKASRTLKQAQDGDAT